MTLQNRKTQIYKKWLPCIIGLAFVVFMVLPAHKALALDCPIDPAYSSTQTVTVQGSTCPAAAQEVYSLLADSATDDPSPIIQYTVQGNPTVLATLYLQNPTANPLLWQGTASYDNHVIDVAINLSDINTGGSDMTAYRTDNGLAPPQTVKVTAADQTVWQDFLTANKISASGGVGTTSTTTSGYECGGSTNGNTPIKTSIDFGCAGVGNPIVDLLFAITRFLSIGVGIVVIGSLVVAGIQFTTSRGDPQATGQAIERIRSTSIALLIFIFAYAILNYVIPIGFFNR